MLDKLFAIITSICTLVIPYIIILLGFTWLLKIWNFTLDWLAVIAGILGWTIAYLMRIPVAILAEKISTNTKVSTTWIVFSSGPLEEFIRLLVLLSVGSQFNLAYSVGLGWGGIEILYTVINNYLIAQIMERTDEEALEQQAQLKEAGMIHEWGEVLGVFERLSATAFHIGATLLIAEWKWLIVFTMVLHSTLNLAVNAMASDKAILAQLTIAAFGSAFFVAGVTVFLYFPLF